MEGAVKAGAGGCRGVWVIEVFWSCVSETGVTSVLDAFEMNP